ncbi:hypothetical protein QEG98_31475 [Myxococcus sp. MxC21-1]|uniref:hypothetical protein n=1 Tax=unclassified Myxococcus TaxID=2648731 RepID=UPI001147643B|nr:MULTISPECIES: hypothetical protein [unclassified Myxococcus]WNZ60467.1 hypothetical protein QEG98_31475 [Myxococcus sp. MxC21-1]
MAPSRSSSVLGNSNLQSVVSQVSAVVGRAEAPPVPKPLVVEVPKPPARKPPAVSGVKLLATTMLAATEGRAEAPPVEPAPPGAGGGT